MDDEPKPLAPRVASKRLTCLYCEQDGVETQLVQVGRWGCCPIHSADFIRQSNPVPEGYALVKKPDLLEVGIPKRRPHTCLR